MENFNVSSNKEPIYSTHDNDQSCVINRHDQSVQNIFNEQKKRNMSEFEYLLQTNNKSKDYFDYVMDNVMNRFEIKYDATKKGVKEADNEFLYREYCLERTIESEIKRQKTQLDDTFCQGQKGVCVGVSALKTLTSIEGLSGAGTKYLNDMVKRDSNGDYIVTLKGHFDPKNYSRWIEGDYEVRVSKEAMKQNNNFNGVKNNDYASAIVMAIAMAQGKIDENGEGDYRALHSATTLGFLTGKIPSYVEIDKDTGSDTLKDAFDKIGEAQANGEKFVMQIGIVDHEWTVISVDPKKQIVVLKNPHDINKPIVKTYDEIFSNVEYGGDVSLSILGIKREEDGKFSFYNPTDIGDAPENRGYITSDKQAKAIEDAENELREQKKLAEDARKNYQVSSEEMINYINTNQDLKNGYNVGLAHDLGRNYFQQVKASGFKDVSTLLTNYIKALKENPDNPKMPQIKGLSEDQQKKIQEWLNNEIADLKEIIKLEH